jgi:hypothetical protein
LHWHTKPRVAREASGPRIEHQLVVDAAMREGAVVDELPRGVLGARRLRCHRGVDRGVGR